MQDTTYDPNQSPTGPEWLNTPKTERVRCVATFHMVNRLNSGSQKAHAAMHVIVENQIATGYGPTVKAMARLQQGGLSRHEALHAIGSVIAKQMYGVLPSTADNSPRPDPQTQLNAAIEALQAEDWLKSHPQ